MKLVEGKGRATLWSCMGLIAGMCFHASAMASPSSVQVCTQVLDNGDANTTEGGTWSYSVSNTSVTYQNPTTSRNESQAATAPTCASAIAPPAGSTALGVLQSPSSPGNWLREAPGYPQWVVSDGTHSVTGSGVLNISGGTYSQFTGPTSVTFTNASGRLVTEVCSLLQDNGVAPSGQSGSFTFTAEGASATLPNTEGGANACNSTFEANIPIGATSIALTATTPFTMEAGYPQVKLTDSANHADTASLGATVTSDYYAGNVALDGTSGDVTIDFTNRIITDRAVTICKTLLDNADGIDQGGVNTVEYNAVGTSVSINVVEGAASPTCAPAISAPTSATTTPIREVQLSGNLQEIGRAHV